MLVAMATAASSVRGISRRYGIAREIVTKAIREGALRAARLGPRKVVILHHDAEAWLHAAAQRPTAGEPVEAARYASAQDFVERRLAKRRRGRAADTENAQASR